MPNEVAANVIPVDILIAYQQPESGVLSKGSEWWLVSVSSCFGLRLLGVLFVCVEVF